MPIDGTLVFVVADLILGLEPWQTFRRASNDFEQGVRLEGTKMIAQFQPQTEWLCVCSPWIHPCYCNPKEG